MKKGFKNLPVEGQVWTEIRAEARRREASGELEPFIYKVMEDAWRCYQNQSPKAEIGEHLGDAGTIKGPQAVLQNPRAGEYLAAINQILRFGNKSSRDALEAVLIALKESSPTNDKGEESPGNKSTESPAPRVSEQEVDKIRRRHFPNKRPGDAIKPTGSGPKNPKS